MSARTVDEVHDDLLRSRSPGERLAMACDMFDFAKECVVAGLRAQGITDPLELKIGVFHRMYPELTAEYRAKVEAHMRAEAAKEAGPG